MATSLNLNIKTGSVLRHSMIAVSFILIFSGGIFDFIDRCICLSYQDFSKYQLVVRDVKFFGALLGFASGCSYRFIKAKVLSFMLCLWAAAIIFINAGMFDSLISITVMMLIDIAFIFWVLRIACMRSQAGSIVEKNDAFYLFQPINTFWGLLQAIFLPWHPARYETRIISDGEYVWAVNHKTFTKSLIENTNIDEIKGVKVPIGRKLRRKEVEYLDKLVGKRAIIGYRDCRKLLVTR